jgi:hypothetical protein
MSVALDFIYNTLDVFSGEIPSFAQEGRPALVDMMDTPRNREKAQYGKGRRPSPEEEHNDE